MITASIRAIIWIGGRDMKRNRIVTFVALTLILSFALSMPVSASAAVAQQPQVNAGPAVTVKAAKPTDVMLDVTAKTILPGRSFQLTATVEPSDASQKVTWKSDKPAVAKVSSSGKVTAIKTGTATITCTTKTGAKKAMCVVTVGYDFTGVTYRFYGIGNNAYHGDSALTSCINDLNNMMNMYSQAKFSGAGISSDSWYRTNATGAQIRSFLQSMVNNKSITENDVTIFYYSGHGLYSKTKSYRGALCGVDDYSDSSYVKVSEVQSYLDQVPGNVIVILDSCLSGQYIKAKGTTAEAAATAADLAAFNAEWVNSFSTSKAKNYNPNSKALTGSKVKSKYKILAACNSMESSYLAGFDPYNGLPGGSYSFFTLSFWDGGSPYGTPKKMDADTNKDGVVSLKEMCAYTKKDVAALMKQRNKVLKRKDKQTVQAWPSGENFPVMAYLP